MGGSHWSGKVQDLHRQAQWHIHGIICMVVLTMRWSVLINIDIYQDVGTRKAALIVNYVDLHNDYVHDRRQHKMKFLELFQSFR